MNKRQELKDNLAKAIKAEREANRMHNLTRASEVKTHRIWDNACIEVGKADSKLRNYEDSTND